jgi:predicted aspartyl protease
MNALLAFLTVAPALVSHARSSVEIPFHFLSPTAPLIMVPVKVNGQGPYDFLLDSGNAGKVILLSPALAKAQHIKSRPDSRQGFTVGLSNAFEAATIDSFEIGEIVNSHVDAAVSPAMTDLTQRTKAKVDGNVGYSFLKDYVVTLDFRRRVLGLGTEFPQTDSTRVPFTVEDSTPLVQLPVVINGRSLTFALDTGASDCCISREAAKSLSLTLGAKVDVNHDGSSNSPVSFFKTVKLGDAVQHDVHCVVVDFFSALNAQGGTHIDGILGYNFWSKYRLTIDYIRSAVILDKP